MFYWILILLAIVSTVIANIAKKKRMDFYKSPTWKEIKNEELL